MKNAFGVITFVSLVIGMQQADAQEKKNVGTKVKNTTKTVGNKVAETASKGKSAVVDKVYKDKVGPNGQTIYINNESKYYWVDKKGHHQFVIPAQLKDKPKED